MFKKRARRKCAIFFFPLLYKLEVFRTPVYVMADLSRTLSALVFPHQKVEPKPAVRLIPPHTQHLSDDTIIIPDTSLFQHINISALLEMGLLQTTLNTNAVLHLVLQITYSVGSCIYLPFIGPVILWFSLQKVKNLETSMSSDSEPHVNNWLILSFFLE